jgi:hypothetical protein
MTVRDIIARFRHFGEDITGYVSDDTSYSDLAIYDQLVTARAVIAYDRNRLAKEYFSDVMFQTLNCVMFNEVDANECGLIPPSGCKILKSTCPIPNTIKLISVTSSLGNNTFDIIRWDQAEGKLNSRIESIKKSTFATIRTIGKDQYLYLLNNENLKNATMVALFEDPVKAAQFCGDKEAVCNPLDLDFHTDYKLIDPILKYTWDTISAVRRTAKPDIINDDTNLQ